MHSTCIFLIVVLLATTTIITTTARPELNRVFTEDVKNSKGKGRSSSSSNNNNNNNNNKGNGNKGGVGGLFGPGGGFGIPGFGKGWDNGVIGGGYGAGYGSPTGGYSKGGTIRPMVVCKEKGPCYKKKLICPAKCFTSYSKSGKHYGGGGGGGSCTIDCKKKCIAFC